MTMKLHEYANSLAHPFDDLKSNRQEIKDALQRQFKYSGSDEFHQKVVKELLEGFNKKETRSDQVNRIAYDKRYKSLLFQWFNSTSKREEMANEAMKHTPSIMSAIHQAQIKEVKEVISIVIPIIEKQHALLYPESEVAVPTSLMLQ